ncbi:MAG: knotted carbamoyltransferase YgeW [Calditrichota bacterium]
MNTLSIHDHLKKLQSLNIADYGSDYLLSWDKSADSILATAATADILKEIHRRHGSLRIFDSGIAISIFRDKSTRTRYSFASAANALGLAVEALDEEKSQISHGETVRETAAMLSFLTETIGIRDDMFLGEGHRYMSEVAAAVAESHEHGVLHNRPAVVNLQCDLDHPTQSLADLLALEKYFGSLEALRGKKIAMSWAYSPSYGKPLSVPQGIIALMTRFGMNVTLAFPDGYDLVPDVLNVARQNAAGSGGSFHVVHDMKDAFAGADVVYPKSWAPFHVMERRTDILRNRKGDGLKELEQECLAHNAEFKSWECTEEMMKLTRNGKALYMHCLPADISGVSCERGEVAASVFDRYRMATYQEASYKPFAIAAMILLTRTTDPAATLSRLIKNANL